jgi:esterase
VFLNTFAESLRPIDMTASAEYASLCQSAADLGIPHGSGGRFVSRQAVVRGLRFHFLEWGPPDATPVLLLHGSNQSAHSWDLVSLNLSDRYHVFALDQRGHGDSEWTRDLDYSLAAKAEDAKAFIEDQGLQSCIILAHSMGGMVAMRLLLAYPELAQALVLVDVGPELSAAGTKIVSSFVSHNVEFDDLEEFLDNVVKYDPFRSREHISRTVKYNMLRRVDGKYVSKVDHRRVDGPSEPQPSLEDLSGLDCPVLLVRGRESDVLEPDAAERFVSVLPRGRLVTVDKAGHNVHSGNTSGFLSAIGPFLAELG